MGKLQALEYSQGMSYLVRILSNVPSTGSEESTAMKKYLLQYVSNQQRVKASGREI